MHRMYSLRNRDISFSSVFWRDISAVLSVEGNLCQKQRQRKCTRPLTADSAATVQDEDEVFTTPCFMSCPSKKFARGGETCAGAAVEEAEVQVEEPAKQPASM